MDVKKKNKGNSKLTTVAYGSLFLVFVTIVILVLFFGFQTLIDFPSPVQIEPDCSESVSTLEWTGVVEFTASHESEILITEENARWLAALGNASVNLPNETFSFGSEAFVTIIHPKHEYRLSRQYLWENTSDIRPQLVLCPADASTPLILSDYSYHLAFSPDGRFFAVDAYAVLEIYDAYTLEQHGSIELREFKHEFAFHPSESLLAIVIDRFDEADSIEIWNYETFERVAVRNIETQSGRVDRILFNTEGTLLALVTTFPDSSVITYGIAPE